MKRGVYLTTAATQRGKKKTTVGGERSIPSRIENRGKKERAVLRGFMFAGWEGRGIDE